MAITFEKVGNKVIVVRDSVVLGGISVDCSVVADPQNEDLVLLTNRVDQNDNKEAIRIDWKKVTAPEVESRNDLIEQLSRSYFYGNGLSGGRDTAVISDTEDLEHAGWFEARDAGGTIKFTDELGNIGTDTIDAKELSKFRVKRIWETGTSATGLVIYY